MSKPVSNNTVVTCELHAALELAMSRHFGVPRAVTRLERWPSACRSSFILEEIAIGLDDGTELRLMFKDLGPRALLERARAAKPTFLYDPRRELEMYRTILMSARLGTAICYGTVFDSASGRYWLFLEKVPGVELYQVGELAAWQKVARWLAGFHTHFRGETEQLGAANLLRYDADFYRLWVRRAQAFWPDLEALADAYDQVIDRLLTLPVTLIHGEFYASNVLVQSTAGGLRVCPVDWEMAAVGPGLMDLAALTAGKWTGAAKESMALAYQEALPANVGSPLAAAVFLEALDYCRLHQAVQWLGWSADWLPPPEHAQDWLSEARRLAQKLGLPMA